MLQTRGSAETGVFGQLPAVLAAHRADQTMHIGAHSPPQIHPTEPVANPHEYFFQLRGPDIGLHIILHDKYNGPPHTRSRTSTT
ncbi:hypothetical protein ACGFWI_36975 [Streptomyces sp. NPDC048434]|uniref:hypothetical protein n=1 Tax=Streptomyces sp. NPDC048434 TaxID=3365549 RepID=UPI00371E0D56